MERLGQDLAHAARQVSLENGAEAKMRRVVEAAVGLLESCDDAALSAVMKNREVQTLAATSRAPQLGDEWQYDLDEGPCLDAIWTRPVTYCPDLVDEAARWPRWAPRVTAELGIRSMLCLRLFTRADSLGALNLYSTTPGAFSGEEQEQALALAAHAAVALVAAHEIDNLHLGISRRTVIGQASGILMERYGLDAEAAFEVLRRTSQNHNRKMHELAAEIVVSGRTEGL